ncbi:MULTISPECIES: hypothetical protein [Methylomonas]|uniref:Elongation factor-1 alpha n=1 Tax=Methylomonas koyamae TaxID=702114 RepID=A0A177NBG9_9GAMM|nr:MULTISPECIES: hypothetical protein [Methylomonas]NJA07361.1 hypothetical protein [Methylococcaceae bacterium WWC4]OAI14440.1 hypothetical protein A1355_12465 [Methylomonas koyamae]OHX36795.1 hypothetical protein BJL95_07785 [Methylomonas sp. LWB]WGS87298.1 hypothetical protein QC632_05985 [Methylomonas sp. UP202]
MAREFSTLRQLDIPVKVLFTGYLTTVAVGYLVALIQILFTHGLADGKFGLSIDDIVYSYYGNRSGTMLETKLNGSMKDNASEKERFAIIQWVRDGADKDDFVDDGIDKIIESRCVMCHNKEASLPDFSDFNVLKELAKEDEGATFTSLTRVSHIHLFGISFIFMLVGLIFSFSETSTLKYKSIAIGMPYVFLLVDILSWWLTKLNPMFAWLVIFAGAGMAISFGFMWLVSVLEMWAYNQVFVDSQGEPKPQWSRIVEAKFKQLGGDRAVERAMSGLIRLVGYAWRLFNQHGLPVLLDVYKKLFDRSRS